VAKSLISLIRDRFLDEIATHSQQAHPEECCGMIRASGLRRCQNIQNELHRLDPVDHPRTAQTAFALNAEDTIFLIESLETDDPVLAVYHSHPDGSAQFSHADTAGAAAYPHLFHLVVGCSAKGVLRAALYGGNGQILQPRSRAYPAKRASDRSHWGW